LREEKKHNSEVVTANAGRGKSHQYFDCI